MEDVTGCFIIAAMGCLLHVLSGLAANRGLRLTISPLAAPPEDHLEPFADLTLTPDPDAKPQLDESLLLSRRTSRYAPQPGSISTPDLGTLQSLAIRFDQRIHHLTDQSIIDRVMDTNLDALIEDINTPRYRDEVVSWFRFSKHSARRSRDGLSAECMLIPPTEFFLSARAPWAAHLPAIGNFVRARYQKHLGPTHQLIAISGAFWSRDAALRAGECLMAIWLELERAGLRIHPFGNLVTNAAARRKTESLFETEQIWIVFRVGKTELPPESHRLTVAELTNA